MCRNRMTEPRTDGTGDESLTTHVAHAWRTSLTAIRSFSEILRDHPDLPQTEREHFLAIMIAENERLSRLVDGFVESAVSSVGDWCVDNEALSAHLSDWSGRQRSGAAA